MRKLVPRDGANRCDPRPGIHILRVKHLPGGHQQVLVSIQVHVHEDRGPSPVRSFQTAEIRDVGISAVASVKLQGVSVELQTIEYFNRPRVGFGAGSLQNLSSMSATEHVRHKQVVEPVPVDIGDINTHRESAGVPEGQRSNGAKLAPSVVDPHAIRGLKVVGHVQVGSAVSV